MKNHNSGASSGEKSVDNQLPLLDKGFAGLILKFPTLVGLVHNHLRRELIFVSSDENIGYQLSYNRMLVVKSHAAHHDDGDHYEYKLDFEAYEPAPFDSKNRKNAKFDYKKQKNEAETISKRFEQLHYMHHEGTPYMVVLREGSVIEIVRNFSDTVMVETRVPVTKIAPTFGNSLKFQKPDQGFIYSSSFEKFGSSRITMTPEDFYKLQAVPPQGYSQYDIHRRLPFYQDSLTVN